MSAPAGSSDSSDARARPAARLPASARAGRKFPGSGRCGRAPSRSTPFRDCAAAPATARNPSRRVPASSVLTSPAISSTLPLPMKVAGRISFSATMPAIDDIEIDGARKPGALVEPRLRRAHPSDAQPRPRRRAADARADKDRCTIARPVSEPVPRGSAGPCVVSRRRGSNQTFSPAAALRPPRHPRTAGSGGPA